MKRSVDLLLVLVLLAGVLAGCAPAAAPTAQIVKETVEVPVTVQVPVQETVVVTAVPAASEPAAAEGTVAGPVTLEVLNPTGAMDVTQVFAPRVSDLEGATICLLSNSSWEAYRTFPVIAELLAKQFPTATILDHTKMPPFSERSTPADLEKVAAAVKEAGCQAAILGNAG